MPIATETTRSAQHRELMQVAARAALGLDRRSREIEAQRWLPQDIAEICSDASVPATAALLAIDGAQARAATRAGHTVDLSQFSRSQSNPDLYYALFDHVSERQVHSVLHRLVPSLEPHRAAA